jgi:hypothetical protein
MASKKRDRAAAVDTPKSIVQVLQEELTEARRCRDVARSRLASRPHSPRARARYDAESARVANLARALRRAIALE